MMPYPTVLSTSRLRMLSASTVMKSSINPFTMLPMSFDRLNSMLSCSIQLNTFCIPMRSNRSSSRSPMKLAM